MGIQAAQTPGILPAPEPKIDPRENFGLMNPYDAGKPSVNLRNGTVLLSGLTRNTPPRPSATVIPLGGEKFRFTDLIDAYQNAAHTTVLREKTITASFRFTVSAHVSSIADGATRTPNGSAAGGPAQVKKVSATLFRGHLTAAMYAHVAASVAAASTAATSAGHTVASRVLHWACSCTTWTSAGV